MLLEEQPFLNKLYTKHGNLKIVKHDEMAKYENHGKHGNVEIKEKHE